jgi:hypothetical protein
MMTGVNIRFSPDSILRNQIGFVQFLKGNKHPESLAYDTPRFLMLGAFELSTVPSYELAEILTLLNLPYGSSVWLNYATSGALCRTHFRHSRSLSCPQRSKYPGSPIHERSVVREKHLSAGPKEKKLIC